VVPVGIRSTVLVTSASPHKAYALATLTLPPYHPGIPQHRHPAHAEGCYIIQGMLAITHDSRTITLTQGESVLIPPDVMHTYWNPTAVPTTMLIIYQPGGEADDITVLAAGIGSDLVVYVAKEYPPQPAAR
jgi:mannose-6-phosphate isomerase-like protein (cupin superfamily)